MYELGAIARGLNAYISHSHLLLDLLPKDSFVGFAVDQDNVLRDGTLIFVGEDLYKVAGRQVGTFEIRCTMMSQHQPQVILRAHDVPVWVHNQLQQDIPKLAPKDLNPIGDQLYRRLLFTSFPLLEPQVHLLSEGVGQLGTKFAQAIALSCQSPVTQIPETWRRSLANRLPYEDLPAATDPLYPMSTEQIVEQYRDHYDRAHYSLRIVRGVEFSQAETPQPSTVEF
jgi:hypothetical protein